MTAGAPVRVVLVSHYFPAHGGGVEIVAGKLASALAASGAAATEWFASDVDQPPAAMPGLVPRAVPTWNGVEQRTGLPFPLWSPRGLRELAGAVRRADVVHVHDYLYVGNIAAMVAAWRWRKPVVVTQHIGAIPFDSALKRGLLELLNRTLGAASLERARQVVFISEIVRRYFAARTTFRRPPEFWPNGVDTDVFRPADGPERHRIRAGLGVAPGQPLLLFVGRLVEKKGLHMIAELARRDPLQKWVVAGRGPLGPLVSGLANVSVVGDRAGPTLAPLYQAADLLVLPSVGEGFPLVVQESMACGTPALINGETAEGCPIGRGLFYTEAVGAADTADRWNAALRRILDDPAELESRRASVAAFARDAWSWTRCTDDYSRLFRQLQRESTTAPPS